MRLSFGLAPITLLIATATSAFSQGSNVCPALVRGGGGQSSRTEFVFTYNLPQIQGPGIAGAPYSGHTTSQNTRTLANGTRLSLAATESPMLYRDSLGRIRLDRMMTRAAGTNAKPRISRLAEIDDPVAGYRYIIDDFHKIVHRIATCTPSPATIAALTSGQPPAGVTRTTVDLGTQTISGVAVTGERITTTFAPGAYQGNDGPVTIVNETWHSSQYGLDFLTKRSDPNGERTQTMTNFTLGEPDPVLFQAPPGYQIVDETAQFTIRIPSEHE